jgi:hypothetical protein
MKKIFQKINRQCLNLAIVVVLVLPEIASAQYFTAGKGDLLLGFRKPSGGTYELLVNVGNITNFMAQPVGTVIPINNFSPTQLSDAFSSYGSIQWSVSATFLGAGPGSTWSGFPLDTIWYTLPRDNPGTQTSSPSRLSDSVQSNVKQSINSIGVDAYDVGTSLGATNQDNNPILVREPAGYNNETYSIFVEDPQNNLIGDFGGYMPSTVENTTPASFTSAVVSDLYQSVPNGSVDPTTGTSSGPAYYIGYFTLNPNGTMTFTRAVAQPPAPRIVSITRAGSTSTVFFTTTNGPTYTLFFTNSAGLTTSVTNWPSSPTTLVGNGLTNSLSDTTTTTNRFYRVGAHN